MKPTLLYCLSLLLSLLATDAVWGQAISRQERYVYADVSLGYARAEDGVKSMTVNTLKQMVFAGRVSVGYRSSRHLAVEGYFTSMLERFSAGGLSRVTNKALLIEPLYQALGVNAVGVLSLGKNWDLFLSAGPALLMQQVRRSGDGVSDTQSIRVNTVGFCVAPGVGKQISAGLTAQFRFDFMNPFGNEQVWQGDLGTAFLGLGYRFGQTKL